MVEHFVFMTVDVVLQTIICFNRKLLWSVNVDAILSISLKILIGYRLPDNTFLLRITTTTVNHTFLVKLVPEIESVRARPKTWPRKALSTELTKLDLPAPTGP